ncbi:MAG: ATPase, T2SS/T4P/T4SS family [Bdellovibrionales bacterium]
MELDRLKTSCHRVLQNLNQLSLPLDADTAHTDFDAEKMLGAAIRQEPAVFHDRLWLEFKGDGPIPALMQDHKVREIIVNGCESIWFEREGQFLRYDDSFLSETTLNNFVHRLSAETGLNINLHIPCGDTEWRGFRVHIMRPPLSERLQITLRSRPQAPWTFDRLQQEAWASKEALVTLRRWLSEKKNLLIVGPTGAGKTSVLNACLQEFSENERVICLEDTSELCPKAGASCKVLTRVDGNGILRDYNLGDLVRQALRMRPTRLVVGEVRGAEAKDLLLALATGHHGSLGTLHASDPRQALLRLEMLVQLGAGQWDQNAIRQLIQLSVDGIVVTGFRGDKRVLEGLYRIASLESIGFLLERAA